MLEWVIKEIVKEEAAERKKKEEAEKEEKAASAQQQEQVVSKKNYGQLAYLLMLIPLIAILFNWFALWTLILPSFIRKFTFIDSHHAYHHFGTNLPSFTIFGTSAASQGPKAIAKAWAIPSLGECLAQRGAKWMSWQIFPPRYILIVLPSSSGSYSSMGELGYVAGISNWSLNSYLTKLWV